LQRKVQNINSNNNITLKSIKGFGVFDIIYKNSIRVHSANLTLAYLKPQKVTDLNLLPNNSNPIDNTNQITIYLGATIGKKNSKKAVSRNRVKRLIREAIAIYIKHNNNDTIKLSYRLNNAFIVISARYKLNNPKSICLDDIQPEINQLLDRILNHK
jgi:ribonuclease P protein component